MASINRQSNVNSQSFKSSPGAGKRMLVTGGGGFIGSHIAAALASRGDEVVVLDNFSTGNRGNLDGIDARLIEGDIRDLACVEDAVQGVDTVFHQAALCSVARSVEDPISTHEVNTSGTLNVFDACRKAGVRRVVFASSSSVYGDSATLPKHEMMPTAPLSPYAISKLACEFYGEMYSRIYGMETVALRYFNVFGPRQDPNSEYSAVIPLFIKAIFDQAPIRIFGDGLQTRDFTYVANVVQANLAAAVSPSAPGKAFNVACGDCWSLLTLIDKLQTVSQRTTEIEFCQRRVGDIKDSQASIAMARELLGYAPLVNFDEGLRETVNWFTQADGSAFMKTPPAFQEKAGGLLN